MKKILIAFLMLFLLVGCGIDIDDVVDDINDDQNNNQIGNETIEVDTFTDELATATEYSYEVIYEGLDKTTNEESSFTYKFAKNSDNYALSIAVDGGDETIYLTTVDYFYSIDKESMTAYVMTNDDDDMSTYEPDLSYLEDYDGDDDYLNKTENVTVNGHNTTCYEYNLYGLTYKYYVTDSGLLIKTEWENDESRWSMEIRNFKTNNIDTSLFTIPTEGAGYTITDLTDL